MKPAPLALAAALALAACRYSYSNPAESLGAGEVSGLAQADGAPAGAVAVSVKGSAFDQATRATGRFSLAPLEPASHTVLLRDGRARAALRGVELGWGGDGRPDGEWLGALDLPRAISLSGSLLTLGSESTQGVAVDETTGIAVPLWSTFLFEGAPVGAHRVYVATRDLTGAQWVGGPIDVSVAEAEQGTVKELAPIAVHAASTAQGAVTFHVVSAVTGLDATAAAVTLRDASGAAVALPSPSDTGQWTASVPEGIYVLQVAPPPAFTATVPAPPLATVVVAADQLFDAGTFSLVEGAAVDAAQQSCVTADDCGAGGACSGGACTGYTPPALAPATVPLCPSSADCSTSSTCTAPGWPDAALPGTCLAYPGDPYSQGTCLRCGTSCTTDGVTVLSAPACP